MGSPSLWCPGASCVHTTPSKWTHLHGTWQEKSWNLPSMDLFVPPWGLEGFLPCKKCQEKAVFPQWKLFLVQLLQGKAALGLGSAWHRDYSDLSAVDSRLDKSTSKDCRLELEFCFHWSLWHGSCRTRDIHPTVPGTSIPPESVPLSQRDHSQSPRAPFHSHSGKNLPWKVLNHSRPFLELAGHLPGGLEQLFNPS